jgi:hypothetical protein
MAHAERDLVVTFLTRYVVWCARARRFERLRNAIDLMVEIAARSPYSHGRTAIRPIVRSLLKYFRGNAAKCFLLWRPQPTSHCTMQLTA